MSDITNNSRRYDILNTKRSDPPHPHNGELDGNTSEIRLDFESKPSCLRGAQYQDRENAAILLGDRLYHYRGERLHPDAGWPRSLED